MPQITYDVPADKVAAVNAAVEGILNGTSKPFIASWRDEIGFPKLKNVDGSVYMLKAPLNPDWKSSFGDKVFGGVTTDGVRYLADPTNADSKHPMRSPAGYPLVYGLDAPGVISDRIPPRILYDGVTHESDLMVEDYKTRVAQQSVNRASPAGSDVSSEPYTGSINPDTLGAYDWAFAFKKGLFSKERQIFTKRPVMYVSGVGSANVQQGDLSSIDVSAYIVNGGPLAPFV